MSVFFFKYSFSICELLHFLMDWISFGRFLSELKKKTSFKKTVSQRLCFWSCSFLWNFLAVVLGLRPSGLNEASQDLQTTPILEPRLVRAHSLVCWLQFWKTQGSPPLSSSSYMWPAWFCFSVKKEFFFILQACNFLLGCIFLQIFLASWSLKGFSLSFTFLCPYDFFISISSFFCSWNSCRMDVGFCISWLHFLMLSYLLIEIKSTLSWFLLNLFFRAVLGLLQIEGTVKRFPTCLSFPCVLPLRVSVSPTWTAHLLQMRLLKGHVKIIRTLYFTVQFILSVYSLWVWTLLNDVSPSLWYHAVFIG